MGGGTSALREMEEILNCTYLLGRAIAAMTFPDMYGIRDFHSPTAPALNSTAENPFLALDQLHEDAPDDQGGGGDAKSDEDGEGTGRPREEDYDYSGKFVLVLGNDRIVIDDVGMENEDGWTPLHGCCHSHTTVSAGLALIEAMQRQGHGFETKTIRGPGLHNSGWTALHMASAYGVEALVLKLLDVGANPNCHNNITWGPLHEACHRGFTTIVEALLEAGANIHHLPSREALENFPFSRPPPQTPLGEAARCGFVGICQLLLKRGADKNQANDIGWTPLHEAAFYNYVEVVQLLLVYGADPTRKNSQGALAFELTCSTHVRQVIQEIGGEQALPPNADVPDSYSASSSDPNDSAIVPAGSSPSRSAAGSPSKGQRSSPVRTPQRGSPTSTNDELLHSGRLLGELPSLTAHKTPSPTKTTSQQASQDSRDVTSPVHSQSQSVQIPVMKKAPPGFPKDLLCAITQRPMQDPVVSPYGTHFEKAMVYTWIDRNGSICPITGQPMSKFELRDAPDVKERTKKWFDDQHDGAGKRDADAVEQQAESKSVSRHVTTVSAGVDQDDDDEVYSF